MGSRNPELAYKVIYIFEMQQQTNQIKYNNDKSRVYQFWFSDENNE